MIEHPEIFKGHQIEAFFTKKIKEFEDFKKLLSFKFYIPIQKHTDNIQILNNYTEPVIADAVITDKRNLFIAIKTADCLPVLIFDPINKVIGAVHAGWRGTARGILKKTINKMLEIYGCKPKNLLLAFGPYIKGCCYEVGDEVIEEMKEENPEEKYILRINGKKHIDIGVANFIQALSLGIKKENIWFSKNCTCCNHNEYASYRFHGKNAGRQYGIIGML
ncbi:peptidoglycan editing factor PgeF [Thermodesulfovibrio yellowstonii]|uniref:peptidoglycan editing factor PgeF n=1 Tax=Thermodesulfovibrio yellowstonii TaxID=28262 RepID=UPI0003F75413|nr:peptidoglycan editing factor PgeF [Thermodesulfovibrio islandicus]